MTQIVLENFFRKLVLKLQYCWEHFKELNRYPYILEGELNHNPQQTILLYRIRGKRDIFQLSAQDICNNPSLISKFHPLDVRIISYIAAIEQILTIPTEQRSDRLRLIKNKIFNEIRR